MSDWISVKERLPELDGKYLLYFTKRCVIGTFYNGNFYRGRTPARYYKTWLTEAKKYKSISHWMPLPLDPIKALKKCPYCGGEARLMMSDSGTSGESDIDPRFWVKCDVCETQQTHMCVKEEAINKWNYRV